MAGEDDRLVRAVDRLVDQVGHWPPARWSAPANGGTGTRGDVVHALVQRLADLEAGATGRPVRPVPRLANDLALPDQIRVLALDLVRAAPDQAVLATALDLVAAARRDL